MRRHILRALILLGLIGACAPNEKYVLLPPQTTTQSPYGGYSVQSASITVLVGGVGSGGTR